MATFILINTLVFLGGYFLGRFSGLNDQPRETIVTIETNPAESNDTAPPSPPPKMYPKMTPRE